MKSAQMLLAIMTTALIHSAASADVDSYSDPLPPAAVARLGTTRLQDDGSVIHDVHYSSDGKTLISCGQSIRVWDAATGRFIRDIGPGSSAPLRSAVSPDGHLLAVIVSGYRICIFDLKTGKQNAVIARRETFFECLAFSPDGKALASGGRDGVIRIWRVESGKEAHTLDGPGTTSFLAYQPGGKTLISETDHECLLWDLESGKVLRRWKDARPPFVLSQDGKVLLTGLQGPKVQLWRTNTGEEIRHFELPKRDRVTDYEAAHTAAFSPDGKRLAVADLTDRVRVWDLETGRQLFCTPRRRFPVNCMAFSPDGKTLAVGAWDRVLLWDAYTGKDLLPLGGDVGTKATFTPDGKAVATWAWGEELILWEARTGIEKLRSPIGRDFMGFSPAGGLLLRSGNERALFRWQPVVDGIRTFRLDERERWTDRPVFSHDGKLMASGSIDRTIRLWNATTGELIWKAERKNKEGEGFPFDWGGHAPLGFTHGDKSLVSYCGGTGDSVLRIWDVATGREQDRARIDADHAVLSPDGRLLVAIGERVAEENGTVLTGGKAPPRYWDLTKGKLQRAPIEFYKKESHMFRPCRPAFSPDGKVLAMSEDCDVILVDVVARKELRRLEGHRSWIDDVAFSPDGKLLVSTSADMTALVWNLSP